MTASVLDGIDRDRVASLAAEQWDAIGAHLDALSRYAVTTPADVATAARCKPAQALAVLAVLDAERRVALRLAIFCATHATMPIDNVGFSEALRGAYCDGCQRRLPVDDLRYQIVAHPV